MSEYKVMTKDGKWFVSIMFGGAYVGGMEDSGFTFKNKKEAEEAIKSCQYMYDTKLVVKKVA